jgi:hypothetical protein
MVPMHITRRFLPLLASSLVAFGGCYLSGEGQTGPRRDADRITRAEIMGTTFGSAYEVVQSLRPQWLRSRAAPTLISPNEVVVYVDNIRLGGVQALQSVRASDLETLERIDAPTATQRWGTGHAGGVIAIQTRRP